MTRSKIKVMLVEDSIRFYSSYLPNIYKILLKQSKTFMAEGLEKSVAKNLCLALLVTLQCPHILHKHC